MDSDEFYDSLDEDSNYGSVESLDEPSGDNFRKKIVSKIPVKTTTRPRQRVIETNFTEGDDIIPFYDQNLSKSEIELKKTFLKRDSNFDGQKNESQKKFNEKGHTVPKVKAKLKTNSYLDMFYAKMGVERIDLSNKSVCSDLSPKSYATCEDLDLTSSLYLSEVESVYSSKDVKNSEGLSLSLISLDSKFYSVSQINGIIADLNPKKGCGKTNSIRVPEMGRLGPEIPKDKLELLKKRQDYGHKVSRKNKIKMIEKKLLQNLKQEIKECKKIV